MELIDRFVLAYSSQDANCKIFKAEISYLPNSEIKSYNVIINGKTFYNQVVDSGIWCMIW